VKLLEILMFSDSPSAGYYHVIWALCSVLKG
jgi:hypothetical protein